MKQLGLFGQPRVTSGDSTPRALTVSELTAKLKGVVEPAFTQLWVQGEVSNYRPPSGAGHVYFSLKDKDASLSVAAFGWGSRMAKARATDGTPKRVAFELKDGLEVLVHGKISLYPPRGSYQLIAEKIEPVGAGALQLAFEQLKTKLLNEGLFDPKLKRALPRFPNRIAVITSPTGAALRDILQVMGRRAAQVRVTIVPALMQGDEAPSQIIKAIRAANRYALGEIILLSRGGGSIEDLWGFNDENLAREIRASKTPVVSAVGHEIDFTISDFVADYRAPTPSAGAEVITAEWVDAYRRHQEVEQRLIYALTRFLSDQQKALTHLSTRLVSPKDVLRVQAQKLDELAQRLLRSIQFKLERTKGEFGGISSKLDALSPLKVLERGYSLATEESEPGIPTSIIESVKQVHPGKRFLLTFKDGVAPVQGV